MALIYVVEDDKNICEIEDFALSNVGYEVRDFACAKDFYKALDREKPDLILLDIMLPDEDGLSIVKKLRKAEETALIPILMVTAKTTEIDKVKGLDTGADDYLTKPFGVMELISRVKALLRRSGGTVKKVEVYQIGGICLDNERHLVTVNGNPCDLTHKEFELLKLLMVNAGVVASREVILNKVWKVDFEGESRSLDMHIKNLRKKLMEEGGRIKTIRNVGYVIQVP